MVMHNDHTEMKEAVFSMLKDAFDGFCMALADAVPGVSGGTVAFIMGFYDDFVGSIDRIVFGKKDEKKQGLRYLLKLGIGWAVGMGAAVMVLTAMFEKHIYAVSSLFIGFIAASIPLIFRDDKESTKDVKKGLLFGVLGAGIVTAVTVANGSGSVSSLDLSALTLSSGIRLFFIGMIAISAMFLPGISGSTLLLVFGAYLPVMTAVKGFMIMKMEYLPGLFVYVLGAAAGAATTVRGIRTCLEKHRTQTIWMILGMMVGSLYAIIMGPATLDVPQPAMSLHTFRWFFALIGAVLVLGMETAKNRKEAISADSLAQQEN